MYGGRVVNGVFAYVNLSFHLCIYYKGEKTIDPKL